MKYTKYVSLALGLYILGKLLYEAKDVMPCDPSPLGIIGVFKIMFALAFIWYLGYATGRKDWEE